MNVKEFLERLLHIWKEDSKKDVKKSAKFVLVHVLLLKLDENWIQYKLFRHVQPMERIDCTCAVKNSYLRYPLLFHSSNIHLRPPVRFLYIVWAARSRLF